MRNIIFMNLAMVCIFGAACDTPSSMLVDGSADILEDKGERSTSTAPLQVEEEPEPLYEEPSACELTPTPSDAPPFGYDADWCFTTQYGMQCEWYVGADGTKGCYESYTYYNNGCAWIFQHDYCTEG